MSLADELEIDAILQNPELASAGSVLTSLAQVYFPVGFRTVTSEAEAPTAETKYRALIEQIPAVVFLAYLDRGLGEAYVSPQIENLLGFSQQEWLSDPVRWYCQIHREDKARWSVDAAQ